MADDTLLEWTDKQVDWVRDALRRHAVSPSHILSEGDKAAIFDRVRHAADIAIDPEPTCTPLAAEHVKSAAPQARTLFCSLGPVSNLGQLAADQKLSFATNGITLIYGDNGCGKSGYCRVAKKVCRSPTSDPLLGNIFTDGAKPPAEALLRFLPDGATEIVELLWKDGAGVPEQLANISVFDSKNARLYIDEKNRFGFLPAEIAILERHAAHRREMDKQFDDELKPLSIRLKVALPSGFTPSGKIAVEIAKFASKSITDLPKEDELTALGAFSDEDEAEMQGLERKLTTDPLEAASRRARSSSQLAVYGQALKAIDQGIAPAKADAFIEAVKNAKAAKDAASVAAASAFSNEPLEGVGTEAWMAMYEYAKKYVASLGHEDLPSEVGQSCALCQQPLTSDGSERLKRFNAFVSGEAAKAVRVAENTLAVASLDIERMDVPATTQIERDLAEYTSTSDAAAATTASIIAFCDRAAKRKIALLGQVTDQSQFIPELLPSLAANVLRDADTLAAEAALLKDQATQDQTRSAEVARLDALKDAKRLNENLPTFVTRLSDLHDKVKLEECKRLVATGPLSTRITAVRRTSVAGGLQKRINAEITNLDLGYIPFAVSDQSENGQSYFEIGLAAPVTAENADILSEGEQRALALACFLGEIGDDNSKSGIIVDDPVSSLDHLRIRKVAERLVAEAGKGRQIIIFTHNLLFYNEVADAAARAPTPVPVAKRYVTKSLKDGVGLISEKDEPWTAQKVTERIARLRSRQAELSKLTDFDTDDYRRAAKDFYTDLRETWERLVEEVLLYGTVERFNSDVKTMRLKGVIVADEDYRKVFWAMKRVSERSGHDMAAGKNTPIPTPDEMKKDIEELDTYRGDIKSRSKNAEKVRETMEKPPKAMIM